jgi:hypothetical protein
MARFFAILMFAKVQFAAIFLSGWSNRTAEVRGSIPLSFTSHPTATDFLL